MKTIKQLLASKNQEIYSLGQDASVYDAIVLMAEKEIGALLVLESDNLVGILSERDYARKVILKGRGSKETKIREIMTPDVLTIDPNKGVDEGLAVMTEAHVRHLPVMENNKLIGMVSIGDLVKEIIAEQQFLIEQLESYVSG